MDDRQRRWIIGCRVRRRNWEAGTITDVVERPFVVLIENLIAVVEWIVKGIGEERVAFVQILWISADVPVPSECRREKIREIVPGPHGNADSAIGGLFEIGIPRVRPEVIENRLDRRR